MNVYITISNVGADAGPFNLYSDVDGYLSAFETNIPKAILEAGFATNLVPEGTLEIRIQSVNELCNNYVNVGIVALEYYFEPQSGSYMSDFINNDSYTYVYGYFSGYYDGSYLRPGNHIVKVLPDGSLDPTFDIDEGFNFHIVYTNTTMYQQSDGKIILAGYFTFFNGVSANRIIRLNTDGTRDNSFVIGTGFNDYALSTVEDNSGRFYVTGRYSKYNGATSPRLVRLLSDGSRDTSFNVGTGFTNTTLNMLINNDNTLILTHYPSAYNGTASPGNIIKINPDATPDLAFIANVGTGFNTTTNQPTDITFMTGDDRIYCAGYFTQFNGNSASHICRLLNDGTFDPTFNSGGSGCNGVAFLIVEIWGEKLLCIGAFTTYNGVFSNTKIVLNQDGSIFLTFASDYDVIYALGNNLYGQLPGGNNQVIYTYDPNATTTTTTTTISPGIPLGNLISYWPLDTNSLDAIGSNNGTDTVMSYSTIVGGINNVADYTAGTTSEIQIPDNDSLSFGNGVTDVPFSYSFFVRWDSAPVSTIFITKKNVVDGQNREYQIDWNGTNLLFDLWGTSGVTDRIGITSAQSFSVDTWYHIVCTYDGNGSEAGLKIYINGNIASIASSSAGTYVASANDVGVLVFGKNTFNLDRSLDGYMDEIALFDVELTPTQVNDIYTKNQLGDALTD